MSPPNLLGQHATALNLLTSVSTRARDYVPARNLQPHRLSTAHIAAARVQEDTMNEKELRERYRYGRIAVLAIALADAGVPEETRRHVLEGGEDIGQSAKPRQKADWMRAAMRRLDESLDEPTRQAVREACACCLGGKRAQVAKGIAGDHATLEGRIAAANEAHFVFGNSVTRGDDGKVRVAFFPEGRPSYNCVCLRGATEPVSITYCYCCGGHVRHHLQTALGRELECRVLSSALASGGTEGCVFEFDVLGELPPLRRRRAG